MSIPTNLHTVCLDGHGLYRAVGVAVAHADRRCSKRTLAKEIAWEFSTYNDDRVCNPPEWSTQRYWRAMPKPTLVIVYADIFLGAASLLGWQENRQLVIDSAERGAA